jgi:hypothetical protein
VLIDYLIGNYLSYYGCAFPFVDCTYSPRGKTLFTLDGLLAAAGAAEDEALQYYRPVARQ